MVRVALGGPRGQVRGVGQDPVEPAETSRKVRADRRDRDPELARPHPHRAQRERIEVGRDHPGPAEGRRERGGALAAPDLEDPLAAPRVGEGQEQEGVLARRIDRVAGARRPVRVPA